MKIKDFLGEHWDKRDAYQRDYDSSVSGVGRQHREIDDEANLMYIYKDGRVKQRMVSNHEERAAKSEGFRDSVESALKLHGIIRSKFHQGKWVQRQGNQWVEIHPFGKAEDLNEFASDPGGMTTAANVGIGAVYKNKSPKQPKNKDGTAKNALDMKGANLLGGGSVKR
jgi:hypothetical protein